MPSASPLSPLPYQIRRHPRARHMRLRVRADASLVVTAPPTVSEKAIHRFVHTHTSWVTETRQALEAKRAPWIVPPSVSQQSFAACRSRALQFVRDRLVHYNAFYQFSYTGVSVKEMTSRWGSCSSEGRMSFHYRLLFLPLELADYVIVHELCHLAELNHSPAFWTLVEKTTPTYRACKHQLDRYTI